MRGWPGHRFGRGLRLFFVVALALSLVLSWLPIAAHADDHAVTPQDAQRAALAWLNRCPDFARGGGAGAYTPAAEMLEIKDWEQEQTLAYVLELQPRGFIIVTPNRELNPIIAYSEDSIFDASETPENILLDLLRLDMAGRIQALERGDVGLSYRENARSLWQSYLDKVDARGDLQAANAPMQAWDVAHGPFLSSTWNQGNVGEYAVWNYYTPPGPDGSTSNYVCGCVATAMAQILNYYEWPLVGTHSHGYTWNSQPLYADFGATTYDWANALDSYAAGSTELERQAAGLVSYHAGVAVDMDYAASGSGAYTSDVAGALKEYFRASAVWVANEGDDFYNRLYANMIHHRPAELAIRDTRPPTTGGHAVVVDGVRHNNSGDTTRYYHLNMGWGGSNDNWYDIASNFKTGSYTWNEKAGAVMDIVPTPHMVDLGGTIPDAYFPVSWYVSDLQNASQYELQQALLPTTPGDFFDGAESGAGNWLIDGNWEDSFSQSHTGSSSFRGYFTLEDYYGALTLNKALKIDASTSIGYWYGFNYHINGEERFEISTDGANWEPLATYTQEDTDGSISWYEETSIDLSAYVGEVVFVRFVIELTGDTLYDGSAYNFIGFFVDDFTISDGYISDWTTVDNSLTAESKAETLTQNGDYAYRVRANCCDPSVQPSCSTKWWAWSNAEAVTISGLHNSAVATGNWSSVGTWDTGNSVPGASNSAIVNEGHTVTVDSNAQCHDLVVRRGGGVTIPDGVTLNVGDDLVNNGRLRQTQEVNGSTDVGFWNTGGYGGAIINANGSDLGSTVVTIRGNQDCIAGHADSSVKRCFDIAPSNSTERNATVRLYFSASELGTIPCDSVEMWHWIEVDWEPAGTIDPGSGRQCSTEPYYVEATGVTSFSPFVLDNDKPPLLPTGVGLARFEADPKAGAILVEWETVSEVGNLGFYLYRAESPDGSWKQLNEEVIRPQAPGSLLGASYAWPDRPVAPGVTYYYWLEVVALQDAGTVHGPVSATAAASPGYTVFLPLVQR